jgi:hypothetical protein
MEVSLRTSVPTMLFRKSLTPRLRKTHVSSGQPNARLYNNFSNPYTNCFSSKIRRTQSSTPGI